ncbi:MAG: glucose-6-phosphate isomerase [Akkermansiaceae bacterium]|nr:glucose-6-phosphate isomerase [Akkermansiaceae bacterium]
MSFSDYSSQLLRYADLGFSLDLSRMDIPGDFYDSMEDRIGRAFADMEALESGAIANPDENRMVGHYWLRDPNLAPTPELRAAVTEPFAALKAFAVKVHAGEISPPTDGVYENLLIIGIGGSALGPQFVYDALRPFSGLETYFFDNTDPDGMDRTLGLLDGKLLRTLVVVISKSGGTAETRNGMLEAKAAYERAGLEFAAHAVAVTGPGSKLDDFAERHGWISRFPMEDWVGGRTSMMSTVGLVPMALQGFDIDAFLAGAKAMDVHTRKPSWQHNAAMQLALAWHHEGHGKGEKDMVILPYKDSLVLFSKYLQQLIMESLGKEKDLDGNTVHQGIAVYGNKGSTDQHAYVQQLRDGVPNFFVTFLEVRRGREGESIDVANGATSADFLQGFLRGTREALYGNGRHSITISIPEVSALHLGALIALFERAVSFYASLVNINAYHQPGVEAGKLAAATFLALLARVEAALTAEPQTAAALAAALDADPEDVYHSLTHLAANHKAVSTEGPVPADDTFAAA